MKKLSLMIMLFGLLATTAVMANPHRRPHHRPVVCSTKNFVQTFFARGKRLRPTRQRVIRKCVRHSRTRIGAQLCRRNVRCRRGHRY